MSWEPELEELRRREALAREMGGEERVERQHASGRRTVRERIERLFDPGTFHETGALAGRGPTRRRRARRFLPANMVCGQGEIEGRRAVVQGDDFTVRGGAADAAIWEKRSTPSGSPTTWASRSCGSSTARAAAARVKSLERMGFSYVPSTARLRARSWRTSRSSRW